MTRADQSRATTVAYIEALLARGAFADDFAADVPVDVVRSGQTSC